MRSTSGHKIGSLTKTEKNCKQVYYEIVAPVFQLQKCFKVFRVPSVSILRERHAVSLCGLSVVIIKCVININVIILT